MIRGPHLSWSHPPAPPTPQKPAETSSDEAIKSPVPAELVGIKSPGPMTPEKAPVNDKPMKSPDMCLSPLKSPRRDSIGHKDDHEPLPALPGSRTPRRGTEESIAGSRTPRRSTEESLPGSRTPRRSTEESLAGSRTPRRSTEESLPGSRTPRRNTEESLPGSRTPRRSTEEPLPGSRTPARRSIEEPLPGNRTPARSSIEEPSPGSRTPGRRSIEEPHPGSRTPGRRNIDETSIAASRTPRRLSIDEPKALDKVVPPVEEKPAEMSKDNKPEPSEELVDAKPEAKMPEMNLVSEVPDPCHQPDDDGDEPIDEIEDPELTQPETPQPETPEKKEEGPRKGRKAKKSHADDGDEEPAPVRSSPRSRGRLDHNENSQERFSSRGRKIIPKERDDDLGFGSGQTRKTRQQTQAESPRGRGRRGAPPQPQQLPEEGVKSRRATRRGSLKNEEPEPEKEEEEVPPQEEETEEVGIARNKGALRRRRPNSRGRQTRGSEQQNLDESREEEESKDSYDDKYDTAGDTDLDVQVDSPRLRRARRGKGRRAEAGSMSPRTRSSEGSISPRGKPIDGGSTSPKASELSRPFVKLEKLRFPEIKADEKKEEESKEAPAGSTGGSRFSFNRFGSRTRTTSDEKSSDGNKSGKDLYEWEDDDEKPPPVSLHTQRPRNKRKVGEWESPRKPLAVEEVTQDSTTFMEVKKEEKKAAEESKEEEKKPEKAEKQEEKKPVVEKPAVSDKKQAEEKPAKEAKETKDVKEVKEKKPEKVEEKSETKAAEPPKVEEKRVEEKKEQKKIPPTDVPDINDTFIPASMSGSASTDDATGFQNHPTMTPLNILVPTSGGEMPRITVPPDSRPQSGHNSPSEALHIPAKLEFKKEKDDVAKGLLGSPRSTSSIQSNLDRVIDDVARGHFSLPGESPVSPSPPLVSKKRHSRSRSREDVHSPRSSISGGVPPTSCSSASPTMASPPTQAMPQHLHGAPQVAYPQEMNKIMSHQPPVAPSHPQQPHPRGVAPQQFPEAKQTPPQPMVPGVTGPRMTQPHHGAPTSVIQSSHLNGEFYF